MDALDLALPLRLTTDPDHEQLNDLELSAEDDAKLDRAANEGKRLLKDGKNGNTEALRNLKEKLHLTRWETVRWRLSLIERKVAQ